MSTLDELRERVEALHPFPWKHKRGNKSLRWQTIDTQDCVLDAEGNTVFDCEDYYPTPVHPLVQEYLVALVNQPPNTITINLDGKPLTLTAEQVTEAVRLVYRWPEFSYVAGF